MALPELTYSKQPPSEFRIFKRGWNATQKGNFLFDDVAAKAVMSAYQQHGVDRMIDLEHLSVDQESNAYDPDARGWFKLALRDGELWAVAVRWTPDGDRRLSNATQRYISPFFGYDEKTKRVLALHNVAIVAIPATNETPALVAASLRTGQKIGTLSIEVDTMDLKKLLSLLGLSEDNSAEDAYAAIKALQDDKGGGDGDDSLLKKVCKALGLAEDTSEDEVMKALADDNEPDEDDKDPKEEKMSAAMKGELLALRENVKRLSARVESQEQRHGKSEVEQLIATNTDKIPLHMEAFLKEQTPDMVRAFLKHSISQPRAKTPPKEDPQGGEVKLTADEIRVAKLSGHKVDDILEHKKKKAQQEKERRALENAQ